jgi:drug/metabolite transporter (DMT)-like permease
MESRKVGSLPGIRDWTLLLSCNLMFATQAVAVKVVQEQMGPVFASFLPVTLATLLLIPVVRRERLRTNPFGNSDSLPVRDIFSFVAMGTCGLIPSYVFIAWGVRLSLASNVALIGLVAPVMTAVMAYFVLGERMTMVRWISFVLAVAGVVECSGIDWKGLSLTRGKFLLGSLLIFSGVLGSAFYNVYSKKLLPRYSPLRILLYTYYAGLAIMLPIALYTEPQGFRGLPALRLTVWAGLIVLALFPYSLAMVIFLSVLKRLDVTQVVLSTYLIPFFCLLLAAAVLHERLTKFMVLGGVLVLGSTLLITVYDERRRPQATPDAILGEK